MEQPCNLRRHRCLGHEPEWPELPAILSAGEDLGLPCEPAACRHAKARHLEGVDGEIVGGLV